MFFNSNTSLEQIKHWIDSQLSAVKPIAKNGLDIEIKPHKTQRTNEQNRFFMVIMTAIVRFYNETGFMPQGCKAWMMTPIILKEFYKAKFGVLSTKNLDKKEFSKFIDSIQLELVEQSYGEWQILTTESAYIQNLINQGV